MISPIGYLNYIHSSRQCSRTEDDLSRWCYHSAGRQASAVDQDGLVYMLVSSRKWRIFAPPALLCFRGMSPENVKITLAKKVCGILPLASLLEKRERRSFLFCLIGLSGMCGLSLHMDYAKIFPFFCFRKRELSIQGKRASLVLVWIKELV
jgi:hypothetical protein